jgi:Ni2+-binding GTPase involved in maturation of urease and hydrogenase
MPATQVILVGGFLGAGKTTLLAEAARRLAARGRRPGLLANDQAAELVDTELFKETGSAVEEVSGGCFCCRFPDMIAAMERLVRQSGADVLLGEPVGSCTDLSATVLQPLKKLHAGQFTPAPFSVLIDVKQVGVLARLRKAAAAEPPAGFPENVLYIYDRQLAEADLIVLNKADLISAGALAVLKASLAERFPDTPLLAMSAQSGEGVDAWLDFLSGPNPAGGKIAAVDYDRYAAGEAALGWMNASARLAAREDTDWRALAGALLEAIGGRLRAQSAQIAHLKIYLTGGAGSLAGSLTGNDEPPTLRGRIAPGRREVKLLINARVHVPPDALRNAVEQALQAVAGDRIEATLMSVRSFFPGRPQPTYRFGVVL